MLSTEQERDFIEGIRADLSSTVIGFAREFCVTEAVISPLSRHHESKYRASAKATCSIEEY